MVSSDLFESLPESKWIIWHWRNGLGEPRWVVPSLEASLLAGVEMARKKDLKVLTIIIQSLHLWWYPHRPWQFAEHEQVCSTDFTCSWLCSITTARQDSSRAGFVSHYWVKLNIDLPSIPQPIYRGVIPMASRAAMKLLSRVSSKTKEKTPSSMSMKFSPCSSYYTMVKLSYASTG